MFVSPTRIPVCSSFTNVHRIPCVGSRDNWIIARAETFGHFSVLLGSRSTEDYVDSWIITVSQDAKSEPSHKYCRYYYPRSQPTLNSGAYHRSCLLDGGRLSRLHSPFPDPAHLRPIVSSARAPSGRARTEFRYGIFQCDPDPGAIVFRCLLL